MKDNSDAHLLSIRRGIWAILGVLLLFLGHDHTSVRDTEVGSAIQIIALITGIIIIAYAIGAIVCRFLVTLMKAANSENKS
jgi:hypothetical protein